MHGIEFIETSVFTRQIKQLATDDELSVLQTELIAQPYKGDLIIGTGGLRKIRMAAGDKGKSASTRVIYYLASFDVIYMLIAYSKHSKSSLTSDEKKLLKQLVVQLKREFDYESI